MGRGHYFFERLAEEADIATEPLPGQPIVEIAGDWRVLVENHLGVKGYSREKIMIHVKFGIINICGCGLEIMRMTKDQLIIQGKIEAVTLQRRRQG